MLPYTDKNNCCYNRSCARTNAATTCTAAITTTIGVVGGDDLCWEVPTVPVSVVVCVFFFFLSLPRLERKRRDASGCSSLCGCFSASRAES